MISTVILTPIYTAQLIAYFSERQRMERDDNERVRAHKSDQINSRSESGNLRSNSLSKTEPIMTDTHVGTNERTKSPHAEFIDIGQHISLILEPSIRSIRAHFSLMPSLNYLVFRSARACAITPLFSNFVSAGKYGICEAQSTEKNKVKLQSIHTSCVAGLFSFDPSNCEL